MSRFAPTFEQLRAAGFVDYVGYLRSPHWLKVRRRYFSRHPRECASCGARQRVELHHARYDHLGRERDRDLVPLCAGCHRDAHQCGWEEAAALLATLARAGVSKKLERGRNPRTIKDRPPKARSPRPRAGRMPPQDQTRADPTITHRRIEEDDDPW